MVPAASASEMVQDLEAHHPPLHNTTTTPTPTPTPPPPCSGRSCPWWPYSSSKDFTSNAALILTILFSALFIALALNAVIRYFIRRRGTTNREENDMETGEQQQQGGKKVVFSPGMKMGEKETTECAICLCEFVQGDVIRVLDKCNHGFHYQCAEMVGFSFLMPNLSSQLQMICS